MIKYLFILINTLTVFFYSLFGGDNGITVSGNIPKSMAAGKEVEIEIKVAKGSMSGFAKLQLELPEGLSLKELDSKGANYSYNEGLAKWVWASLPSDNEIVVKAILIASSTASGVKTVGAKYSFVENNAKQVIEMVPIEVTIENASAFAATPTTETETNNQTPTVTVTESVETVQTETVAPQQTETPVSTPTVVSNSNKEPVGNVTVVRTISKGASEGEYIINLKVKKGLTKGFARYSDFLPSGITAKSISTEGSSFSVADGKVKFVWVNVSPKEELELSYSLSSATPITITLKGEYSYLEENQSKKYLLTPEELSFTTGVQVTTTTEPTNTATPETTPTPTETIAAATPKEAAVPTPTETPTNTNPVNETLPTTTTENASINYMVQIGAFSNRNITASYLKQKFGISETVKSEMQGGLSKFMVGSHSEYKGARDQRESIRNSNGASGAFVVAYNQSKRITVQEALMISSQKWYK